MDTLPVPGARTHDCDQAVMRGLESVWLLARTIDRTRAARRRRPTSSSRARPASRRVDRRESGRLLCWRQSQSILLTKFVFDGPSLVGGCWLRRPHLSCPNSRCGRAFEHVTRSWIWPQTFDQHPCIPWIPRHQGLTHSPLPTHRIHTQGERRAGGGLSRFRVG